MFNIGDRAVGDGHSIFIIAEAGVNHNGSIEMAKKMVDEAVKAGADAIKFQTFKAENLVTDYAQMAKYQSDNIGHKESQFDMLKKLQLSYGDFKELKEYCEKSGIMFMSTPFDFESAKFLNDIGISSFKISSGDLTNIPFLEYVAGFKKPVILSSGMATLGEVEEAIGALKNSLCMDYAVLHCTSNYPASFESVNLNAMLTIKRAFNVVSGYSDHTEGIVIPIAAASLGGEIIEKHFTLDKNLPGPDHRASLNPVELNEMVNAIRSVEKSIGNGIKTYNLSEIDTMAAARKSIVAADNIKKGQIIEMKDLAYKRPGTGLQPKYYRDLIGKKAKKDINKDEQMDFNMIE